MVLALWLMADGTIRSMGQDRLARAVDVDLAGLADIYASGSEAELIERIGDRLELISREADRPHYLLARDDGTRLAGDLRRWPMLSAQLSEAGQVRMVNGDAVYGRATQLAPDLRLLVAREFGDDTALRRRMLLVFLAGGAALVLGVGAIGWLAGRRLSGRIDLVNNAFREPDANLKLSDGGDEIDELARQSAAAIARMQRLVEAHRETSDHVAHEIRTPLMHLDNRLIKALHAGPTEPVAEKLVAARDDIRRLIAMLEALLDIASSKARRGDRHGLRTVNLSQLVQRVCDLYADSAEESGHRCVCDIADNVHLQGEEMQLTRLVTNLLDNAFKYVPVGGLVTLTLRPGPVLSVEDDGPGVPVAAQADIFKRFKRGGTAQDLAQGSGLGLALAKAIAERHDLDLSLNDSPQGALFVLRRADAEGGK